MMPDWGGLVSAVEAGDPAAADKLCRILTQGAKIFLLHRKLYDCDDVVQDVVLTVMSAIWKGEIQHPELLGLFFRTILRRRFAHEVEELVEDRARTAGVPDDEALGARDFRKNPEQLAYEREQADVMVRVLEGMRTQDREVLSRFYLDGHSAERIQGDMDLTETQFRLLKTRAKARFGELGRELLKKRAGAQVNKAPFRRYTQSDLFVRI